MSKLVRQQDNGLISNWWKMWPLVMIELGIPGSSVNNETWSQ